LKTAARRLTILLLTTLPYAFGQYYNISTVAGNGRIQLSGLGGPGVNAGLVSLRSVTADTAGNVYFSESYFNQVLRIGLDGTITVVAGNATAGFSGDNGQAASAQLNNPNGLAVDTAGNLYIADTGNARIRKVNPAGVISTFAGDGRTGFSGDGGPALSAELGGVSGLAFDTAGNLYFSQIGSHLVRVIRANNTVAAVAGKGTAGFSGDNGAATAADLSSPGGLAVDSQGNVFIADTQNSRIRKVTSGGIISTVAGTSSTQFNGDGIAATTATLALPNDVAVDSANNLYIADSGRGRLRRVNGAGIISTLAGAGTTFLDGPGASAELPGVTGIAIDNLGNVILSVNSARQIRRLKIADATIQTIAGVLPSTAGAANAVATSTSLLSPYAVAVDTSGSVYIADAPDHRVQKVSAAGTMTTVAGNGIFGITGNNGPPTQGRVGSPVSLFYRSNGDVLVGTGAGAAVRKIGADGILSTVAGGNGPGFSGDGGPATAALFLGVAGIATDSAGNIFISDTSNNRVRRVDAVSGNVATVAGNGVRGFGGDNAAAVSAQLNQPRQLAFDSLGNLYIADTGNHRVRKMDKGGVITTFAGTGISGGGGENGPASAAQLNFPPGVAVDANNNVFIVSGNTVRKVDAATGIISRVAGVGTGTAGFAGDGALASNAQLSGPLGIAIDQNGALYVADEGNKRVRKLTPAQIVPEGTVNGATSKVGGVSPGEIISIYGFDLGPASPAFLKLDANGKVATEIGGTQVLFDGKAAPVIYASQGQVNVIVPYGVSGSTLVQVVYQGKATNTMTLPVVPTSPGFFAITNQNGSVNAASNRADRGSVLVFYGTGEGQTSPAGIDGAVPTSDFPKPLANVSVKIGGQVADILYVGAAPGFVSGVLQMNVRIPASVTGSVPLEVTFGTAALPTGTQIHVK
jgi:trimeric autotransporter adhesin